MTTLLGVTHERLHAIAEKHLDAIVAAEASALEPLLADETVTPDELLAFMLQRATSAFEAACATVGLNPVAVANAAVLAAARRDAA